MATYDQETRRKLLDGYLKKRVGAVESAPAIPRRPAGVRLPMSFAQQQVWLHAQLAPGIPIYNEPMTISRIGTLDIPVLERCMVEIIRRHEIWRTTFDMIDEQPVQVVHDPPAAFHFPLIDLSTLEPRARDAEALRILSEEAAKPLDLKKGPLVRGLVLRVEHDRYDVFFSIHQIILDGVTAYYGLFRELVALYEAFSHGKPSPLPEPAIQYADYALWHRDWVINADQVRQQMSYWSKQLAGDLPVLQWPNDRPRPSVQTYRGKVRSLMLPQAFLRSLRNFCEGEAATLYMALLAGFVVLMHRYTAQEDVIIGTVSANRKQRQTEKILGYFLNPLPLRVNISGDPSFRDLLARVRQVVSEALSNDDVPFEQLVKKFHKTGDASRNPLFQSVVSLEPKMPAVAEGWDMLLGTTPTGASKLDLYINFDERRDGLMATITYNPDLFEDATIPRLVDHWQTVLQAAAAAPDTKISELPLITEAERRQLLVEWNATAETYPQACIHELFEAQARKTPDRVAFICDDKSITYTQLNQRANQLAHYLRKQGVAAGQRVAVYMDRSLDLVTGLLAILKLGAAYVPIDPAYPSERVQFMLRDAEASAVLCESRLAPTLPQGIARIVCSDREWTNIARESVENPSCTVSPDDVAYMIYTSGSTGRPKGVMGTHRGAVNRFHWMWQTYPFEGNEVCCQKTSISFVDSVWETFGPLLRGIETVIIRDRIVKDLPRFVDSLAARRITRIVLVPSLLRAMLDTVPRLAQRLPRLKYWVTSGEALTAELAGRLMQAMPQATLLNLYGSSEIAADSTWHELEKEERHNSVPIGRPIANTQVYILDGKLQPVPVGTIGELYIGGDGLALGYWNRPELTAERFVRNPFHESGSKRLFKTGDMARYLADGTIEYWGRRDNQVKIRGQRVDIGEVESVLVACPGVKQAVVNARNDPAGDITLAAYVVTDGRTQIKRQDLQLWARKKLPEAMIPSTFVVLESLPLLPNGKIDRKALPDAGQTSSVSMSEPVAPRNDVERKLIAIWREVLGITNVGIHDDFFDLGGHSLLIPAVLLKIERAFQKRLSSAAIFQAPTIAQLAALLESQSAQLVQLMPIQPLGSKPPFFCICLAAGPLLRELAMELGNDQPFLGLGFNPSEVHQLSAPYSLENVAEPLMRTILEEQPEGPYFIGGFCLNGLIAFEVARQLEAQGKHVALLSLFEAVNPAYQNSFSQSSQLATLLGRFRFGLMKNHLLSIARLDAAGAKKYFLSRFEDISRDTRNLLWSTYVNVRRRIGKQLPHLQQILYVAARSYQPVPYDGRAAFYRCTDRRANSSSELERGWYGLFIGDFELHVLDGDHLGILAGESLHRLASKLKASLADACSPNNAQQKATLALAAEPDTLPDNPYCGAHVLESSR